MAKKIIWSKKAKSIYDNIIEYLEYEISEDSAKRFSKKVTERLDLLSRYPESGRITKKRKGVRLAKIDKFRVIYYKVKDEIIVLYLFDTRQNPKKNPY